MFRVAFHLVFYYPDMSPQNSLNPKPYTKNPKPWILDLKSCVLTPKSKALILNQTRVLAISTPGSHEGEKSGLSVRASGTIGILGILQGLYRGYIGVMLGLYWDNGKMEVIFRV